MILRVIYKKLEEQDVMESYAVLYCTMLIKIIDLLIRRWCMDYCNNLTVCRRQLLFADFEDCDFSTCSVASVIVVIFVYLTVIVV